MYGEWPVLMISASASAKPDTMPRPRESKPVPRGREGGPSAPKRGRGQPAKEETKGIRAYAADMPRLARYGKTQAEAVRNLLERKPVSQKASE